MDRQAANGVIIIRFLKTLTLFIMLYKSLNINCNPEGIWYIWINYVSYLQIYLHSQVIIDSVFIILIIYIIQSAWRLDKPFLFLWFIIDIFI